MDLEDERPLCSPTLALFQPWSALTHEHTQEDPPLRACHAQSLHESISAVSWTFSVVVMDAQGMDIVPP